MQILLQWYQPSHPPQLEIPGKLSEALRHIAGIKWPFSIILLNSCVALLAIPEWRRSGDFISKVHLWSAVDYKCMLPSRIKIL